MHFALILLSALLTCGKLQAAQESPPVSPLQPLVPSVFAEREKARRKAPEIAETTPQPIDVLIGRIRKKSRSTAASKVAKAMISFRKNKFSDAREKVRSVRGDEWFSDYAPGLQSRAWREEALDALKAGHLDEALKAAQRSIERLAEVQQLYPYSPFLKKVSEHTALSELVIGDVESRKNRQTQAQKAYERAFQRLQQAGNLGLIRPESLSHYASSCAKKPSALCPAWIHRLATITPKHSVEGKALLAAFPDAYDNVKAPPSGKQSQKYPGAEQDQQAFENALEHWLDGRNGATIRDLTRFLDEFPRSGLRFRAKYWLAHTLGLDGQKEKSERIFEDVMRESPFTFYGLLASIASGKPIESQVSGTLPQGLSTDPFLLPQEIHRLKRAERFLAEGAREMAEQELRELKPRDALSAPFLLYVATLHHLAGNHSGAFPIFSDLIARNAPGVYSSFVVRMIFPVVFYDLIQSQATTQKLDPILVLSLIKQESAFEEEAASSVGASGLMQLMPATASETEPGIRRADLIIPEHNIRVGTKYLRKMLDRYNGNIAFALAAYNAGPGAVDRWIREGKARRGLLEFIEQIPYKETREYVGAIIRNHFWYSKVLSNEPPRSLGYFWNLYGPPETVPSTLPSSAVLTPAAVIEASPKPILSTLPSSRPSPAALRASPKPSVREQSASDTDDEEE